MAVIDRRAFLARTSVLAALAATAPSALARVVHPQTVRIRGHVTDGRRGVPGVAVSDGIQIVETDADGRYSMVTTSRQPFVFMSVPAGWQIPVSDVGTARFHAPITSASEQRSDFRLMRAPGRSADHAFVVLADTQTQNQFEMDRLHAETVPDVARMVGMLGTEDVFGVACGDIMFDDLSLYPQYEKAVSDMGIPFFQVVGNHDLDFSAFVDVASTETFSRHFGPRYYSFDRGDVHYVVLDDVFWNNRTYMGYLDADQLVWLEADLGRVAPGRTVVVFAHIPLHGMGYARAGQSTPSAGGSVSNRAALYRLLEPYNAHVIQGHTHESEHIFEGGVHSHVLGTACGAWWSGDICYDGTPNGYGVFTVRGSNVSWQYKSTGQPIEHQLRVFGRGADPAAPDEIVANVWNWDPEWAVVWYEGGDRRGMMARRRGTDPRAEREQRGPELPEWRSWVDPVPTDHLFYAPVAEDTGPIVVEATDWFGNVYSASPGQS